MKPRHRDIFICTVQHTGTWTLVNNLAHHPQVGGVKQLPYLPLSDEPLMVHRLTQDLEVQEAYSPTDKRQVFLSHISRIRNDMSLVRACHTVGGLRDPIMSILTARRRALVAGKPSVKDALTSQVNQWFALLDWVKHGISFQLIPVDNVETRDVWWAKFLKTAGLKHVNADWQRTNCTVVEDAALDAYIRLGTHEGIQAVDIELSVQVARLMTRKDELSNLLLSFGYKWPK